ncbi:DNA-directed RNA polymerase III subunit RPC8-like isoform X2 [Uloborus diversus]|uniref:DNA-directed RNA polymerase III subunit RPC8-like isoform X2 n=1 Tax=Uloborus diversus TaxID=327109 RepID=UPI00240A41B5|nr:DNA-directed RNA polymerase III subunit RPC8-like isoform X2 [Uloborus diversus]
MFTLVEMKDTIRIPPWKFRKPLKDAISDELRLKFANKVVIDVGLCIALFEITKLEESYIFPGDGASHTGVHFSYIVFRPFMNEVLVGKIRSCSREGVHVSLGFFDDILIPQDVLQHPSRFDEKEQLWVWVFSNEESGETHDLFMDRDEPIRFRVVDGTFVDTTPTCPENEASESEEKDRRVPYSLTGAINEHGLRLLSWWS